MQSEGEMRYASVCSGVEAASLAWQYIGWEPVWFSEIEAFPCAVLYLQRAGKFLPLILEHHMHLHVFRCTVHYYSHRRRSCPDGPSLSRQHPKEQRSEHQQKQ